MNIKFYQQLGLIEIKMSITFKTQSRLVERVNLRNILPDFIEKWQWQKKLLFCLAANQSQGNLSLVKYRISF